MDVSDTTTEITLTRDDIINAIKLLIEKKSGIPKSQIEKIGLDPDELPEELKILIKHTFKDDVKNPFDPSVIGSFTSPGPYTSSRSDDNWTLITGDDGTGKYTWNSLPTDMMTATCDVDKNPDE